MLNQTLLDIVPKGDVIHYTSRARIIKWDFTRQTHHSPLILTDNGVAFLFPGTHFNGSLLGGAIAKATGHSKARNAYIPYEIIFDFEKGQQRVHFRHTIPEKPGKNREWRLIIQRCKDPKESKDSWKQRQKVFGPFFEKLYLAKLGK